MSEFVQSKEPGKYFEDFILGDEYGTPGRTVTEADIVNFAGLTADWAQIHTDKEFASKDRFGERVAHGLLELAILSGLVGRTRLWEGTIVAFLGMPFWRFTAPVKIGDTIEGKIKVVEKKETNNPESGIVTLGLSVINQRGKTVSEGQWALMMRKRGN